MRFQWSVVSFLFRAPALAGLLFADTLASSLMAAAGITLNGSPRAFFTVLFGLSVASALLFQLALR